MLCVASPSEVSLSLSIDIQLRPRPADISWVSVFVDVVPDENLPAARGPGTAGRLTRAALPALSVLSFFGAWQVAAATGIWNQTFVPYPSTVWRAFIDTSTVHDGVRGYGGYLLWEHLYMTLRRVLAGVVIGVTAGVVLGVLMGSVGWVRRILEPWLTFLRALPPLAYFFLLVIWLGIDEAPKITLLNSRCRSGPPKPAWPRPARRWTWPSSAAPGQSRTGRRRHPWRWRPRRHWPTGPPPRCPAPCSSLAEPAAPQHISISITSGVTRGRTPCTIRSGGSTSTSAGLCCTGHRRRCTRRSEAELRSGFDTGTHPILVPLRA